MLSLVGVPGKFALSCREAGVGVDLEEWETGRAEGRGAAVRIHCMKEEERQIQKKNSRECILMLKCVSPHLNLQCHL